MVLRYKVLAVCVATFFVIGWLGSAESFPFSATTMYDTANKTNEVEYNDFRILNGSLIDDVNAFYTAPSATGEWERMQECFDPKQLRECYAYFQLVARWVGQPVIIENMRWDYQTGQKTRLQWLTVYP